MAPILLLLPMLFSAFVLIAIGNIRGRATVNQLASQQMAQIVIKINQHVESLVGLPAVVDQINISLIDSGHLDRRTTYASGDLSSSTNSVRSRC